MLVQSLYLLPIAGVPTCEWFLRGSNLLAPESEGTPRSGAFFCPSSSKLLLLVNKRATGETASHKATRTGRRGEAGNGHPSHAASLNKTCEKVTSYGPTLGNIDSLKKCQETRKLRKFVRFCLGKVFGELRTRRAVQGKAGERQVSQNQRAPNCLIGAAHRI